MAHVINPEKRTPNRTPKQNPTNNPSHIMQGRYPACSDSQQSGCVHMRFPPAHIAGIPLPNPSPQIEHGTLSSEGFSHAGRRKRGGSNR